MVLWLAGLVVLSNTIYQRHFLGQDFATYNQAWSLIGQGHLNPFRTIELNQLKPIGGLSGYPFIKSDFELIVWPLSLLHVIDPQPIVLLWVQALAIAACGFVTFLWIVDYLERKKISWSVAVGVSTLVLAVIVVNPGVYQTLLTDIHIEPISAVFILLAGRDLWSERFRRAWIWIAIALLCGTFAAVTLVGLGLSAIAAGRKTRWHGAALIAVALGWLGLVSLIGANLGSGLDSYGYLANHVQAGGSVGIAAILAGIVLHPSRAFNMVVDRLYYFWLLIKPVGVVGLASAWGFGVPFVVLLANVLNSSSIFIFATFQNFVVFPFLLVGSVMVLVWLAQRFRFGWILSLVATAAVVTVALSYGITTSPSNIRWAVSQVPSARAAALTRALALVPPGAEVVATHKIVGRFGARSSVYWFYTGAPIPVKASPVVFVFDPADEWTTTPSSADDLAGIGFARGRLGARVLMKDNGVTVLEWHPPAKTREITFPAAPGPPVQAGAG